MDEDFEINAIFAPKLYAKEQAMSNEDITIHENYEYDHNWDENHAKSRFIVPEDEVHSNNAATHLLTNTETNTINTENEANAHVDSTYFSN